MKKIISLLLVIVTMFTILTSCNLPHFRFDEDKLDGNDGTSNQGLLIVGQWLLMINDAFGMESYIEDKPYFDNIKPDNPYFAAVQIAAEWDVVDVDEDLDTDNILTWRYALISLVNAGNFVDIDRNNWEKLSYAVDHFNTSITDELMDQPIRYDQAILILATAQEMWATKSYSTNIENVVFKNDVVNLSNTVKNNYQLDNNQVVIPSDVSNTVVAGSVYILPSKDNPLEYTYYRATSVAFKNGSTYITNSDEELELEDVVEELQIHGTIIPTAQNTVIYDAEGNILSGIPIIDSSTESTVVQTSVTNKHTFKVNGNEIYLSYNLDGDLNFKIGVKTDNVLTTDKYGKLTGDASFEVSKLKIIRDFDYSIWSGLKSATLRVDYETKTKVGATYSYKPIDGVFAPSYSNGNGKFLTNFKRAVLKEKDGRGAKTIASKQVIKICSLNVYNAGVAKVCLDVNLEIAFDGSFTITVTQGGTVGVEYKKGNLRFIKNNSKDTDAQLKAQLEVTVGFGPGLYLIGLKKQLVGLQVNIGAGVAVTGTFHLVDEQSHLIEELTFNDSLPEDCEVVNSITVEADPEAIKLVAESQGGTYNVESGVTVDLHVETCFDISAYGILKFGVTDNSYVAKFIGGKVKLTCTVFDSKNARFFNYHVDNGDWANGVVMWGSGKETGCNKKYVPFDSPDNNKPEEEIPEQDNDITFGDLLVLTDFLATVNIGEKYSVVIAQLPHGYSLDDITFESSYNDVATVDSNGVVEAKSPGSTIITVRTKDGKHFAMIAVKVLDNTNVDFEGVQV